jgi:hypothetical protein
MRGVAVCSEADASAREAVHVLQHRVSARFPSPPDTERSLANIDVTRAIASVTVAPMDARSTDEAIQALFDGFHGIHRFDQNPHLDHVTGFPVVAGGFKARGDDHTVGVFVKEKSVQRIPPTMNSATMRANTEITRNASARSAMD